MTLSHLPQIDPTQGPAATPIAFIQTIVLGYRRYGADPANALRLAQIPPAWLDDPARRVTATQMEVMSAVAMQELDDEALGWFSRKLPWGSYGMLCRASLSSPDAAVALKRWCRHHRLLTDDIVFTLTVTPAEAIIAVEENCQLGAMRELCLVTSLRYVLGYACWLIDSQIPLSDVGFPYAPPAHREVYPLIFPGPVRFDAGQASVSFDRRYLDLPVRRDEADLQRMLKRALLLTVLSYRRDRLLVARVRQVLRTRMDEACTADDVAALLHLSTRTLHRRLREEGAALQDLKEEARRQRAVELLHKTSRPIKQVATATGFRNEKSFIRAFKAWTGEAPGEFREHARRDDHKKP